MRSRISTRLAIIFLTAVACRAQDSEVPEINIVVLTEKDYSVPRSPISEAIKYVEYDKGIIVKSVNDVQVEEGDDEKYVCEKIFDSVDRPPTILIDTTRRPRDMGSRISPVVKSVANKMGLPTISATYGLKTRISGWENLSPQQKEYLVQVSPPGDIIPQAVRDICTQQVFKSAGIIYDKGIVMDLKYSTLLENVPTRHIIQVVDGTVPDMKEKLKNMRPPEIANYFVIGSKKTIENALNAADELNLFGREFSWFFITKDNIKQLSCPCRNITGVLMSPMATQPERLQSILRRVGEEQQSEMDVSFYFDLAEMIVKVLKEMKEKGLYPQELTYPSCDDMTLTDEQRSERNVKLLTALQQFPFEGTFGKFRFEGSSKGNFQAIKLKMAKIQFLKSKQIITGSDNIGIWEYQFSKGSITFEPGKNLKEFKAIRMYRVTTIVQPPFIYKTNKSGEIAYTGYCIDLLDRIKVILEFDYTIFETADGKFGAMDENNEWNGMIRDIKDRKAEIALGPISVMAERETVVDFTVPYYDLVGITILMKKTKIESSLFKFLTVLENKVWGCILAAYFFTSFLMFLFDRLSPYSFHNNREKYKDDDENRDFTIKECLWFCMTSLTPQGGGEAPRNLSGRLVAATWWLFGFIIIASYTANLAAFLTVSRLDSPIESLDDLAKQYKIKYAPQNDTSSMTYFKRMAHIEDKFYEIWKNMSLDDTLNETERAKLAVWDYPVSDKYTKIWWTMNESKMPKTFLEGVERVKNSTSSSGFAFIADSTQVKYAIMTNCDLVSIGSEFSRKPLALAVQQGSTLKDEMSSAILKLLNERVLEGLKETWWNNNPDKQFCDDSDRQSDGISIANIGGVFIVIFIGIVLSCITLVIEYWYYKHKRSNNRVVAVKDYTNDPTRREKR